MASMNNWLGFSLSPQELQDHQQHPQTSHIPNFNSDEISTTQISEESCFDHHLTSDSPIPSLNLPAPPFGIMEAFNRNNPNQEWNMSINTYSCSSQNLEDQNRPKLENFLGVHQENSYNIYQENEATSNPNPNPNTTTSTIGLSMITNWLRNNPTPPHAAETKTAPPPSAASSQSLSLSISQSTTPLPSDTKLATESQTVVSASATVAIESVPRKSIDTFGQRTSIYRGVTRHRWTGRYEAHLWDNSCRREGQTRKGRQVYLGGYDKEDKAARAYDLAALKYWGTTTTTNFPMSNYEKEIENMKHMTRQEYVASLRRKSSGFSRGASMYRGVTRHHQHGRWQARIGRVAGNKDLYLGTFSTEEEAAEAYDIAAIKFRGLNAVTNFEINRYDVKSILESTTLPIGGAAKRLKDAEKAEMALTLQRANESHLAESYAATTTPWPTIAFQQPQPLIYPYGAAHQRLWCKPEHDVDVYSEINHHHHLTHNFLQPNSVLHNMMGLDSSSIEGANGVVFGNGSTVIVDGNQNGFLGHELGNSKNLDYEAMNFYYQNQQSSGVNQGAAAAGNWIPTGVPARGSNMAAAGHGASTFTVWNDT
ncbi:AP2-like ethylene-responsive transcription factor AIL1 [Salvia splendens]|uniref:AP2-like ethylene-responsive transcription factor AIL1 n=1 Tax=Salvia splendens TaxID=180675 RepID=UPI001C260464|nr:AP2-like ethylene-responsive transcription factor AIL1 [Salvia splendens]